MHRLRPVVRDTALILLAAAGGAIAQMAARESAALTTLTVLAWTGAAALHASLAMGRLRATLLVVVCALVLRIIGASGALVAAVALAGLTGVLVVARSARRAEVQRAGAWAGAVAGLVVLAGAAGDGVFFAPDTLERAGAAMLSGLLAGAVVLALGPVAERALGHTTPLTLSEWLSYDHPLLRDLAVRAPGTFQHSVNVGMLADAAARAIGANALLVRAGSLFHDVGKMRAPEYFIENQGGDNPHDHLPPWESAVMLRAHVTDGAAMLRAHHMGEALVDFVIEHHGTSAMRLLMEKAKAMPPHGGSPGETYHYPGPKPHSRETGVVMIADQLEATARAQPPEGDEASRAMVEATIDRITGEGQLQASGLTKTDLGTLAPALARTLQAMYHRRLMYPGKSFTPAPRKRLALVPRFFGRARPPRRS